MDKENVIKTQEMWKDYSNAKKWIEAISDPSKHIEINDNKIISLDSEYILAVESLSYVLLGNEIIPSIKNEINSNNKKVIDK